MRDVMGRIAGEKANGQREAIHAGRSFDSLSVHRAGTTPVEPRPPLRRRPCFTGAGAGGGGAVETDASADLAWKLRQYFNGTRAVPISSNWLTQNQRQPLASVVLKP